MFHRHTVGELGKPLIFFITVTEIEDRIEISGLTLFVFEDVSMNGPAYV